MKMLSDTPACRAFFCNNPFIFEQHDQLYAAVFVDGNQSLASEEVERMEKEYLHPGLSRLFVHRFDQEHQLMPEKVHMER